MNVRVDAFGAGDGKGTHVSMYVYVQKGEYDEDLHWPLRGEMIVQILNWKDDSQHFRESVGLSGDHPSILLTASIRSKGRGRHQLIAHRVLENTAFKNVQFLQDDCLRFRIERTDIPEFTPGKRHNVN